MEGKPKRRGYANDDIFYLEVCLFNHLCMNGDALFSLKAGEPFQCDFSWDRLQELEGLLRDTPQPVTPDGECTDCPGTPGSCPRVTEDLVCYAENNPDLLDGYCKGAAATCDWVNLRWHFDHVGASEGRTIGCQEGGGNDLACYAERYPDLLNGYCNGITAACRWSELRWHQENVGKSEGRTLGCT